MYIHTDKYRSVRQGCADRVHCILGAFAFDSRRKKKTYTKPKKIKHKRKKARCRQPLMPRELYSKLLEGGYIGIIEGVLQGL